jgi:hypothetical protein
MNRARFTEEQIIGVLKEHEAGAKTADLARKPRMLGTLALANKRRALSGPCSRRAENIELRRRRPPVLRAVS